MGLWLCGKWTLKGKMKPSSFHWGTIKWCVWALLTVTGFHKLIWESQRSSRKHSPLQFSPSCSSWGCSLKWNKLVKKLKFSSFTLLGQSFCIVPAPGFRYIGQMLRASRASLRGSSYKSRGLHVLYVQAKWSSRGTGSWSAWSAALSLVYAKTRETEVIRIHF